MDEPRGSFKTGDGKWFVACWECKKGINGKATCSTVLSVKSIKNGCFSGQLLDKFTTKNEQ